MSALPQLLKMSRKKSKEDWSKIDKYLRDCISLELNIKQTAFNAGVSEQTIDIWLKRLNIRKPKGFKSTGKKIGRPKGIPMSEKQKQFQRQYFRGENNPFYGKKHSTTTKIKMSENHADFSGDKNPFRKSLIDPEKRKEHKKRCKNIWESRDDIWRKRFGEKYIHVNIPPNNKNHKSGFFHSKKAQKEALHYRSSWELRFMELLENCENIVSFKYEWCSIEYLTSEGYKRAFRPDFLIETHLGKRCIVEIKPRGLLEHKEEKLFAQIDWCKNNNYQFFILCNEITDTNFNFEKMIFDINQGRFDVSTRSIGCRITDFAWASYQDRLR